MRITKRWTPFHLNYISLKKKKLSALIILVKTSRWEEPPAVKQQKKNSQSTNFLHQFSALKYTREVSPDHPSIRGHLQRAVGRRVSRWLPPQSLTAARGANPELWSATDSSLATVPSSETQRVQGRPRGWGVCAVGEELLLLFHLILPPPPTNQPTIAPGDSDRSL